MIRKVVVIIKQNINILLTNVYKMHIKYIHNIKGKKERGNGIKSLMFQIHFFLLKNFYKGSCKSLQVVIIFFHYRI